MSDMAKQARAAMKAKAKSLTSADPHQKVDSSTWSPPEALNTTAKTGMRPISRRAFKAGGKVEGEKAKCNMGRAPRKSGGSAEAKQWMNAKINRNVKDANEEREGIKHVGGMKKGGRTKKTFGGVLGGPMGGLIPMAVNAMRGKDDEKKRGGRAGKEEGGFLQAAKNRIRSALGYDSPDYSPKMGPESGSTSKTPSAEDREAIKRKIEESAPRKAGGRAKKAAGGDLEQYGKGVSGAAEMMKKASARAGVPGGLYGAGFQRVGAGKLSPMGATGMTRLKKGGKAESHPDEKMDIALIKKMVKPEARKGRATGGEVFSGSSYPGKIPGVVPGGREARATGGKTRGKGKTNINIIIAAGKPASAEDMMAPGMGGPTPPPGFGGAPGGIPVPVPAADGASGAAPMPMQAPMPMPMPAAPPMGRKTGGRVAKFGGGAMGGGRPMTAQMHHHPVGPTLTGADMTFPNATSVTPVSFPPRGNNMGGGRPMTAGMGRPPMAGMVTPTPLTGADMTFPNATSVQSVNWGAPPDGRGMSRNLGTAAGPGGGRPPMARKAGGRISKVASSYKDMEAGSGGGEGRLQKTDIAKKHKDAPAFRRGGKAYRSYKDMDAGAGSGMGRLEKTEIQARKK